MDDMAIPYCIYGDLYEKWNWEYDWKKYAAYARQIANLPER